MTNYIKVSIMKFKNDALSKVIYDVLKWIFLALVLLIPINWIPSVKKLFVAEYTINAYSIIISSVIIVAITTIIVSRMFRKRIKTVLDDNYTDELTGLKNHKALNEFLNLKMQDAKNKSEALSIIIIDIDDFKNFNTAYGFNIADEVLSKLGILLGNDKRVTDETFRYFNRGDEFLIVASETSLNQAIYAAERKRKLIEKNLFSIEGKKHQLTVCCGVTQFKKDDDYISFTDRVVEALNEAKKVLGKNNTISVS